MMSGKTLERSDLIDVSYSQLHDFLSGRLEGTSPEQVKGYLAPRVDQLKLLKDPFGKPSEASRKRIQSGTVTLSDGVVFHLEDSDKDYILGISDAFKIDEVNAFILLRSFMYNQGLPATDMDEFLVEACVEAITPFYLSERIAIFRVLIPLFRAKEDPTDPAFEISRIFLGKIISDGPKFVESLLTEYTRKTKERIDERVTIDPRTASKWAKQNMKEQLVMLEVLFWTMWGSVACDGSTVEKIFTSAYTTNLGTTQQNAALLLDEDALQLKQDITSLWILITIEVLELETLADAGVVEISDTPSRTDLYTSSPTSLERIHDLVMSNNGDDFACTYLAWTSVVSRVSAVAGEIKEIPDSYRPFLDSLVPQTNRYSKDREPTHVMMMKACLSPNTGLFRLMLNLLTTMPLFVTSVAMKTDSSVTDTNAIAFRSVFKGLIIALLDLTSVENIPDFDSFVEVWIALFGRSESRSVAGICSQYWQFDWEYGPARRAIFDVARSRFPIQVRPLVRLARAMTASGFLDTDPLCTPDETQAVFGLTGDRDLCDRHVFFFLENLPTYSQGPREIWDLRRHWVCLTPIRGLSSFLEAAYYHPGSIGRVLSGDGGELLAVCWSHQHSGWKLMLDILADYVKRRNAYLGARKAPRPLPSDRHSPFPLTIEDSGLEMDGGIDESLITDILDLIRSLIQDNPTQAEQLLQSLEADLTMTILEETFTSINQHPKSALPTQLITSAMSVLAAILAIPRYSTRVWIYMRSTSVLFGAGRSLGSMFAALAAERTIGRYTVTLALLHLAQQLFHDATTLVIPDDPHVRKLKAEVLLRATEFIHNEIWVEHLGWRYARVGDRFDIGRHVASLFVKVLEHTPEAPEDGPFVGLSRAVLDLLLGKATNSTIIPLVSSITAGRHMLQSLYASRRKADAKRVILLLESQLRLIRLILNRKRTSPKLCLLEQVLCSRVTDGTASDPYQSRVEPIDVLASYVKERDIGSLVPIEAIRIMSCLCDSLSSQTSVPTIVGHLTDPEATAASLVRIVQHPYEDLSLRFEVWNFIAKAMNTEPALAKVFVVGQFRTPSDIKGKGKETDAKAPPVTSAIDVAREMVENWQGLWEHNPQLLSSILRFLDVTWQHGLEHKLILDQRFRDDTEFWSQVASVACSDLGPLPVFDAEEYVYIDGIRHSTMHETVSSHSYRIVAKAYALHILGLDIGQSYTKDTPSKKSTSFKSMEDRFRSEDELTDLLSEAVASSYRPELFDDLEEMLKNDFPGLTVAQLQSRDPLEDREYGDDFSLSASLLRSRLKGYHNADAMVDPVEKAEQQLLSINLNQSLSHSQMRLTESTRFLLSQVSPYLRGDAAARPILVSIASSISYDLAREARLGDMVATIHGKRLALLLAILEVAWFSTPEKQADVKSFVELVDNVRGIILNEYQLPSTSFLGSLTVPFHHTLLQILYFCAKNSRALVRRPKLLNADQRLTLSQMIEASLNTVIDAMRVVLAAARSRADVELDRDLELLVSVFEQCSRHDINPSPSIWLAKCQETNIVTASLQLFARIDLVGLSDLPLLITRHTPLYVPHLLLFHMALASIPSAAERLASGGVLAAYSNNMISPAISAGSIDVDIAELTGERSPAHYVYCSMVAVVSGVIGALGSNSHYFDAEACGLVQLYSDQITRALSWSVGDVISLPLLEEIEQVVHLFYSIAESSPPTPNQNAMVEKTLRLFTHHALHLLQQLNYAITHPNQLASLFEPVTKEEQTLVDKDPPASDPLKRPLVVHLVHRLYRLSSNIIATLISISQAFTVLSGEQDDWPVQEAFVVPHSKVVLGEPASLGTLLELGNSTLDLLKELVGLPPGQSLVAMGAVLSSKYGNTLDVRQGVITARRNLEGILIYAGTQLAMWLSKPDFEATNDVDMDEPDIPRQDKERRVPRPSLTVADRMRRGMTGEMAADLQSLLTKSRDVIKSTDAVIGAPGVDVIPLLSTFIHERISPPV
ncbi:uncharacterized protein EV420DRAFT_1760167 [Desarmillaria tabescens]|uniref:Nucleoporin Nup188 N-terminal subdomain III domain-containing protein n=1 Tax=Armillaria tabescens TaxID=1929756 RepID=A0AA39NH92_ARMTA|nr:uncharacterized protein EV420DRAFT_1760167 [Desarmillaria tabescens]KAK0465499.1 hypothetical protein EV420DRAFT_1760167 [Desarmillaria tabescens]